MKNAESLKQIYYGLDNVNINIIQYVAIVGSLLLFLFVLELVRRKKIKEQYSILWLFITLVFLILSFWRDGLYVVSRALGIATPAIAFLLVLTMGVYVILIQFSMVISNLAERNKKLTQELSLVKYQMKLKIKEEK